MPCLEGGCSHECQLDIIQKKSIYICIYLKGQITKGETEVFYLLIHFPNCHNCLGWAGPKLGAMSFTQVSCLGGMGSGTWTVCCLPRHINSGTGTPRNESHTDAPILDVALQAGSQCSSLNTGFYIKIHFIYFLSNNFVYLLFIHGSLLSPFSPYIIRNIHSQKRNNCCNFILFSHLF